MKKNYFLLAATTMMFAACAQTDLVNEVVTEEAPQAIGFETFVNKATRANDSEADIQVNGGFHVWGYKIRTGENEYPVFTGNSVYWNSVTDPTTQETTSDWKYDDTQYWDMTSDYTFYAVAPNATIANVTYGITNEKKITITGAKSAESTASYDHLVANPVSVTSENNNKETVEFTFNHVMSKLSFKLVSGVSETIKVTSLTMSGWDNGLGNYTQDAQEDWEIPNSLSGTCEIINDTKCPNGVDLSTDGNKVVGFEYIMVPQTIEYIAPNNTSTPKVEESGLKFNITYYIGSEKFMQEGFVKSNQTWSTNTHTTYTITVGPEIITFGVESVTGWPTPGTEGTATIE